MHRVLGISFLVAQITGTYIAMSGNFILNNRYTYQDVKLKGVDFVRGLVSFCIYCSFGALINVVLSGYLYQTAFPWWLAGVMGAVAGAVWNYAVTAVLTWRVARP
jgi:dolichol-phosphate mannosyltransferase